MINPPSDHFTQNIEHKAAWGLGMGHYKGHLPQLEIVAREYDRRAPIPNPKPNPNPVGKSQPWL